MSLEQRIAALERQVDRLARRDGTPHALGRTTMAADDSGPVQTVQVRFDALSIGDDVPIMYHHGFFSSPPIGTDMHVTFLNGDRSKAVNNASNHQPSRFKGASPGDAGLYAQGVLFHLTAGGILVTGNLIQTGDITQTGSISASGSIKAGTGGGDSVGLQTHTHPSTGAPPTPGT
jgi:phage gp45-like